MAGNGRPIDERNALDDFLELSDILGIRAVKNSFHSLRNTMATNYIRNGGDAVRLQLIRQRRVLQITASPFREDGRPLDGKIIFEYPLRKAHQEGYSKPIRFRRVVEFNQKRSDEVIARTAIEQPREDLDKTDILMAAHVARSSTQPITRRE